MAKQKNSKVVGIVILVLVFGGALGFGVWQFIETSRDNDRLNSELTEARNELNSLKNDIIADPSGAVQRLQQAQTAGILEQVRKLYAIPEGETPTIATVQDVEKLRDQPFFEGAQNGDVLIVFDQSGQAILFRPSENRLVKVGPISIQENQQAQAQQSTDEASENE